MWRFTATFSSDAAALSATTPVACRLSLEGLGGRTGADVAGADSFLDSNIRLVDALRFSNQSATDFRLECFGDVSDLAVRSSGTAT